MYVPGDIVNGHQLNESGTAWIPVEQYATATSAPPTPPVPSRGGLSLGKKIGLGIGGGFLALLVIGAMAPDQTGSATNSDASPTAPGQASTAQSSDESIGEPQAATDPPSGPEGQLAEDAAVAKQEFTQPGDDPDADLAFVIMAKLSPSIDGDKGWSDRRILTLGGKAASMWENGAKEAEVVDYLQDNGMTMLTSYYFMAGAVETYCSSEAADRYSS